MPHHKQPSTFSDGHENREPSHCIGFLRRWKKYLLPRSRPKVKEETMTEEARLVFVGNAKATNRAEAFDMQKLGEAPAEAMGKGDLGTAYKAMLDNGLVVMVKKLSLDCKASDRSRTHLNALGNLTHSNLVPIKAWYFAQDEKLLVYEYIHGSISLHALLHGERRMEWRERIEWEERLKWAGEVAKALAYLHTQKVVHGNIKSSNVLINIHNKARLTNYGLVELAVNLPRDFVKDISYTAPEIMDLSRGTIDADVYSFGVLLLELLTGEDPQVSKAYNGNMSYPSSWVQLVLGNQVEDKRNVEEMFDLSIARFPHILEEMNDLFKIAMSCTSLSPTQRPSINDVAKDIDNLQGPVDEEDGVASLDEGRV